MKIPFVLNVKGRLGQAGQGIMLLEYGPMVALLPYDMLGTVKKSFFLLIVTCH